VYLPEGGAGPEGNPEREKKNAGGKYEIVEGKERELERLNVATATPEN